MNRVFEWLERQANKAEFAIRPEQVGIDAYRQHRVPRKGGASAMAFSTLDFDGLFGGERSGGVPVGYHAWIRSRKGLRLRPDANSQGLIAMASMPGLAPPRPIPIKDRASIVFIEKGQLDVLDGAFVMVDQTGVRTHIPVGGLACLMLQPGTRTSHAAVALALACGLPFGLGWRGGRSTLLRGPAGRSPRRPLLHQARLALDPNARLNVVRKMYDMRLANRRPSVGPSINCAELKARE